MSRVSAEKSTDDLMGVSLYVTHYFALTSSNILFFLNKFIYFNWRLINLQYCIGFNILYFCCLNYNACWCDPL